MAGVEERRALLIVDMQYDFCEGGSLAVPGTRALVPVIRQVRKDHADFFNAGVFATQDWHPPDHSSFATSHDGRKPFETIQLEYGPQTLWPPHCVQNSHGAEIVDGIDLDGVPVVKKGTDVRYDSYSGFADNAHMKETGLKEILLEKGVSHVYVCGVAAEYCIKFTAADSQALGFKTTVLEDAIAPLSVEDAAEARRELEGLGVTFIRSTEIEA